MKILLNKSFNAIVTELKKKVGTIPELSKLAKLAECPTVIFNTLVDTDLDRRALKSNSSMLSRCTREKD